MFDTDKILSISEDQLLRIKPLSGRILLEWEATPETYGKTNLIRPDGHRYSHYTGIVIAIGRDVRDVEIGDRLFFDQFWGGEKFYFRDKRYAFVNDFDVMAKIPKRDVEVVV